MSFFSFYSDFSFFISFFFLFCFVLFWFVLFVPTITQGKSYRFQKLLVHLAQMSHKSHKLLASQMYKCFSNSISVHILSLDNRT